MNWKIIEKNRNNFDISVQPETGKFYARHRINDDIIENEDIDHIRQQVDEYDQEILKLIQMMKKNLSV